MVYVLDYKADTFTYMDKGIEILTGFGPKEITPALWKSITLQEHPVGHTRGPSADRAKRKVFKHKKVWSSENLIRHANGSLRWVSDTSVQNVDQKGNLVCSMGILQDITESKRLERELRTSYQRMIRVMNSIGALIYIADMQTYEVLFINEYGAKVFGDIVGKLCWKTIQKDQVGPCPFCNNHNLVDADGHPTGVTQKEFLNTSNGRWYDCRDTTIPWTDGRLAKLGIAIDITERKRAEEALQESETRFRRLFDESPVSIIVHDKDTGEIIDANPSAWRAYGFSSLQDLQANDFWMDPPYSAQEAVQLIRRAAIGEKQQIEWKNRTITGEVFWSQVHLRRVDIGGVERVLCVGVDITDRKQAEDERAKLQAQLLHSQKVESLGRLAGGVAHDFNNKLQVILGLVEIALMDLDVGDPMGEVFLEIRQAAQQSADLTRGLLGFARKQVILPRVLDLNDSVGDLLKMLIRLLGEDINLTWRPGPNLWPVEMDPTQLDQILTNLVANSREAMHDTGNLVIETTNQILDEAFCAVHRGSSPGEYVLLQVCDTGCGMDNGTLAQIFDPFFTAWGPHKGTGLGMSLVYGIVKQNNGFIQVESEPDRGTSVSIYFPRAEAETLSTQPELRPSPRAQGVETILLVDDESSVLKMAHKMLQRLGYKVLSTSSPDEALRLAKEHEGTIHLLVTDMVMPGTSGPTLARMLSAVFPGLKCLYMSGYAEQDIALRNTGDIGKDFLRKPFTLSDLARHIRGMLDA